MVGTSKFPILIDWIILVLIDVVLLGVAMIAFERVKLG